MTGFWSDLRFAVRQLAAKPGFAAAAILTLALGIGANFAVFSLLNGYFLKPLPYPQGGRLVIVRTRLPKFYGTQNLGVYVRMYQGMEKHVGALSGEIGFYYAPFSVEVDGRAHYVAGGGITGNMFRTLGVKPVLGRALTAADDRPGQAPVAVISYSLWKQAFGGDPAIVGQPIKLNGKPHQVVGVMPRGFAFSNSHTDVWVPNVVGAAGESAANTFSYGVGVLLGRLKPGASHKTLRTQLGYLQTRLINTLPNDLHKKYADSGFHFVTMPFRQYKLEKEGAHTSLILFLLLAGALLVLLLTCVNVANLLLARSLGRVHEIALRRTLGATRVVLMRQLFVEGLCLALPGGLIGAGLGWLCVRVLAGSPLNPSLSIFNIAPDWRVGLLVLAAIGLTVVLVSLLPALFLVKTDLKSLLQGGGRAMSGGRGARRARNVLAVVQITLATGLLASAGLLVHSFVNLGNVNVGFNPRHVIALRLLGSHADKAESANLRGEILRSVQGLPGVETAAMPSWTPLNDFFGNTSFKLRGRKPFSNPGPKVYYNSVTRQFFKTLGIPILKGRGFNATDTKNSQLVAVVDARFAKRFFGEKGAIGQEINLGGPSHDQWVRIVGVARPIKLHDIRQSAPYEIYLSDTQIRYEYGQGMRLLVRTDVPPMAMVGSIKAAVNKIAPALAVYGGILGVYSMPKIIHHQLYGARMFMAVVLVFGCIALALAVIGVYGVLSYAVIQRRNEFGIRLALGAMPASIRRLVIKDGLKLLLPGLVAGLILAVAAGFALASVLFHVLPYDPLTLIVVVFVLGGTTLAACYLPARRMAKLNPATAILEE